MSDKDFAALLQVIEQLSRDCNTPELAISQLQSEGLLDENGELPEPYREPVCS